MSSYFQKLFAALGLVAVAGATEVSYALPLFAESAAIRLPLKEGAEIDNDFVTLYPDHEDKEKFYFFPNSSRYARDSQNVPVFNFTYWGLTNGGNLSDAGAMMSFAARLVSDQSQARAIQNFLKSRRRAGVAVLSVKESTLRTLGQNGQPINGKFFEEFNIGDSSGRGEDEIAVNAVLNGLGAKVFRNVILTTGAQLRYCYKAEGLGPQKRAEITLKMKRIYNHFRATATAGGWWTKVSIATEIETLRKNNDVTINIIGGDAKMEEYAQEIADMLIKRFFVPEVKMDPAAPGPTSGGWSFSRVSLSFTHREEHEKISWISEKRELVQRDYCLGMTMRDLAPYKDKVIFDADNPT